MKKTLLLDDKQYTINLLDELLVMELTQWAIARIPSALSRVADEIHKFPERLQDRIIDDALAKDRLPKTFDCPEVQAVLQTPAGLEKLFGVVWQLPVDEVWDLHKRAVAVFGDDYFVSK